MAPGYLLLSWNMSPRREHRIHPTALQGILIMIIWPIFVVLTIVMLIIEAFKSSSDGEEEK